MIKMICSRARQCKQTADMCYHKSPHDINTIFCSTHVCKFNQTATIYETACFEIDMSTNKDVFTCIKVKYI